MNAATYLSRGTVIAGLVVAVAFGDTLVLKDGQRYEGDFISGNQDRVRFRTGRRVTHNFHTRDIDHIAFGDKGEKKSAENKSASPAVEVAQPDVAGTPQQPDQRAETPAGEPSAAKSPRPTAMPHTLPLYPRIGTNSTTPLSDAGAIDAEYTALGTDTGVLGPPRAPAQRSRDGHGVVRFYMNGDIYWTPNAGAHPIYGPIRSAWLESGAEQSRLGLPIADEEDTDGGYLRFQRFEHGSITWNQRDGARIEYTDDQQ